MTVEKILHEVIRTRGYDIVVQYAAKSQKRFDTAAAYASQAVAVATGFLVHSVCGIGAAAAVASFVVWPVAKAMGNKASLATEKKYTQFIDDVLAGALRGRNLGKNVAAVGAAVGKVGDAAARLSRAPLGAFIAMLNKFGDKVPACLRPHFVGTAIRAFINDYVRVLAGVELDYTAIAQVLLKHRGTIRAFLEGRQVALRDVVVDMVDAVPEATLDEVSARIRARLSGFTGKPFVVPFNPSTKLANMIM